MNTPSEDPTASSSSHLRLAPVPQPGSLVRVDAPVTVAIADRNAQINRLLHVMLDLEPGMSVVWEVSEQGEVETRFARGAPDVLVLDPRLDESESEDFELVRRLKAQAPGTQIVVLRMDSNPVLAQLALEAGAIGFVLKDRADTELAEAIRCAAGGREYISPGVADSLLPLREHSSVVSRGVVSRGAGGRPQPLPTSR